MKSKFIWALLIASVALSPLLPVIALAGKSCMGNACADIQYIWDSGTQRYLFTNQGGRSVEVELRNWVAGEKFTLEPGKSTHAWLQVFEVPFRANYD